MEELYDGPSEETIRERQAAIDRIKGRLYGGPVEDAKRQDDMKRGDYLEDPEQPFDLNTLLQIGGAAGSMIPFIGGNILRYLFSPRAMAAAPYSLNPPRIMPFLPKGRTEHDPLDLRSDDEKENQHMMIYGGKWNKPI